MRRADDEMYAVKRDGKNAFKVARSMEPGTAERRPSTSHYVDGDIPA
jgi:hypothetical protein